MFNPSIVRHPDQSGAPPNGCRFILSLRAVGEGHISSLTFRSGTIARGRKRGRRSDRASRVGPESPDPDDRAQWRRRRGDLPVGRGAERTGHLSDHRRAGQRHRGCPLRANSTTTDEEPSTRPIRPTAAGRSAPSCSKRPISRSFRMAPLGGTAVAQQGHGAVPAQDRRPLRDDRTAGQREPLSHLFRRSPHVGRRPTHPAARNIRGSSCRSATAGLRSSSTTAGCC